MPGEVEQELAEQQMGLMVASMVPVAPGPGGTPGHTPGTLAGTAVDGAGIRYHSDILNMAGTSCGTVCLNMKRFY